MSTPLPLIILGIFLVLTAIGGVLAMVVAGLQRDTNDGRGWPL